METTLFVARIFAIYLLISGLFFVLRARTLPLLLKDLFGNRAITYLIGIILVVIGSVLLLKQDMWEGSWRTLMMVFSVLALAKGLAYIFFPQQLDRLSRKITRGWSRTWGFIAMLLGLLLVHISF